MKQQDFRQDTFFSITSLALLAALASSLIAGAVRLFTFGILFGEYCDDICDVPSKLIALPMFAVVGAVFLVPAILAVGFGYALYSNKYNSDFSRSPRFLPVISALLALAGLVWFFPILRLGNPVQTPENTVQWSLIAILTGFLFPVVSSFRRKSTAHYR